MIIERRIPTKYRNNDIRAILAAHNIKILVEDSTGYVKLEGESTDFQAAKTAILALQVLQDIDA